MKLPSLNVALLLVVIAHVFVSPRKLCATTGDAVVRILSTTSNDKVVSGTGVIVSGVGVLTCYHVVEDARSIQVLVDGRSPYADVVVQKISPLYDLALLSVRGLPASLSSLSLSKQDPSGLADRLDTYGFPGMTGKQHLEVNLTSGHWVASGTLRSKQGPRLFAIQDVDLITVSMVIYGGISGAPLISNGKVAGIISGSYDEGGAIAWAIPVKYIDKMVAVNRPPEAMASWPTLALMSPQWHSVRSEINVTEGLVLALDEFMAASKDQREIAAQMAPHLIVEERWLESLQARAKAEIAARGASYVVSRDPHLQDVLDSFNKPFLQLAGSRKYMASNTRLLSAIENLDNQLDAYLTTIPPEKSKKLEEAVQARYGSSDDEDSAMDKIMDFADPDTRPSLFTTSATLAEYMKFYAQELEFLKLISSQAFLRKVSNELGQADDGIEWLLDAANGT
jgi:hypothetical protein